MSQITLNKFFDIPRGEGEQAAVGELCVDIPDGRLFIQLPESAVKLQDLRERVETLQKLQDRLEDATAHQTRDRVIACIAGAFMIGLIAGIVLGALFCPPLASASGITLLLLGLVSGVLTVLWAAKDHREEGWYTPDSLYLGFMLGIPTLMAHLLTRKNALQNKVDPLQIEIRDDLLEAGQYLQQHIPAIRAKLQREIADFEAAIELLPVQVNRVGLRNLLNRTSRALLIELHEKGQPLVDRMTEAGILF